jgi:hypothetical protein
LPLQNHASRTEMAQLVGAANAEGNTGVPKHHCFKDTTSETPQGYDIYKVLIDSDEGRAYTKLTTDPDRLHFMRQYAHEKMPVVFATWHFYEDHIAGKEYSILIDCPEGREVDALMGDFDAEQSGEAEGKLLAYFKAHAHEVDTMTPKPGECEIEIAGSTSQ